MILIIVLSSICAVTTGLAVWASVSARNHSRREKELSRSVRDFQERIERVTSSHDQLTRDLQQTRMVEEQRKANELFLESIFNAIQDGISVSDADLNILKVNRTMHRFYPHIEEFTGKKCWSLYHGRTAPCDTCPSVRAVSTGTLQYETVELKDPDGSVKGWLDVYAYPMFDYKGKVSGIVEYVRDITGHKKMQEELRKTIAQLKTVILEREKAQTALRESETRYRFLFEESPSFSLILSMDGIIIDCNASICSSLGYTRTELIGRKALEFIVPEHGERVAYAMDMRFRGEKVSEEIDTPIAAKDGTTRYVNFASGTAHLYHQGAPYGILITGIDMTGRRHAEALARQQEKNLIQADKMATLGILVSGVAHEINNPNNLILLNSSNLRDIWKDLQVHVETYYNERGEFIIAGLPWAEVRSEIPTMLIGIVEGTERIRRIVASLKDFARKDPGDLDQVVDIGAVIEAAMLILGNLIKKSTHNFIFENSKVPHVRGNFQQIEQVIINLVTNACQALTGNDQSVVITTGYEPASHRTTVRIEDKGRGIAQENINHIFDPFFTTKRDTGGTGLGLAITYNIVKNHQGDLQISSREGEGTVAMLWLPEV
jgi:PAS domain S-box-containing protein